MHPRWLSIVAFLLAAAWLIDALTLQSVVGRWVLPPLTLALLFYEIFGRSRGKGASSRSE